MEIKLLNENAKLPEYGSDSAIGLDLYACPDDLEHVKPGERKLIPTGIAISLPSGTYGRIAPRSGLAVEYGVDVMAGVIDADYRGEIKVLLVNHGEGPILVSNGAKIAQLIVEEARRVELEMVDTLEETGRGSNGFGSTGD